MRTDIHEGPLSPPLTEAPRCQGCLEFLSPSDRAQGYAVCLDCTRARHRAVLKRRCVCGRRRRETEIKRVGSRSWVSCHRCLGQVRQLS